MEIKTIKIFSLCKDFNPDEGFEEMYDDLSEDSNCDSYIEYTAYTAQTLVDKGYVRDAIANRLVELGANDGEKVFIHLDY